MRSQKRTAHRRTLLLAALCFMATVASATTMDPVAQTCPVCANGFDAMVLMSTNNFGGQDRDFLTRAGGHQPILIYPVTCPKCYYSGYGDDFSPKTKLPDDLKDEITSRKALKPLVPIDKDMQSHDIPAWVRYDLIAQTLALRGRDYETLANQYLSASWAVRLDDDPLPGLDEPTLKKVRAWIEENWDTQSAKQADNPCQSDILQGKAFAEKARAAEGEPRTLAALAAIRMLRDHGENTDVLRLLPLLDPLMEEQQYAGLRRALLTSIQRERSFQTRAVALFENAARSENDAEQKAILTYLCGELHRRLENWDRARTFFRNCAQLKSPPDWLPSYITEQQALLPKD